MIDIAGRFHLHISRYCWYYRCRKATFLALMVNSCLISFLPDLMQTRRNACTMHLLKLHCSFKHINFPLTSMEHSVVLSTHDAASEVLKKDAFLSMLAWLSMEQSSQSMNLTFIAWQDGKQSEDIGVIARQVDSQEQSWCNEPIARDDLL